MGDLLATEIFNGVFFALIAAGSEALAGIAWTDWRTIPDAVHTSRHGLAVTAFVAGELGGQCASGDAPSVGA